MVGLSHRFSNAIIGLYMVVVVTYSGGVLLFDIEVDDFNSFASPYSALIIKMEFPFDSNTSPAYELVIVSQF